MFLKINACLLALLGNSFATDDMKSEAASSNSSISQVEQQSLQNLARMFVDMNQLVEEEKRKNPDVNIEAEVIPVFQENMKTLFGMEYSTTPEQPTFTEIIIDTLNFIEKKYQQEIATHVLSDFKNFTENKFPKILEELLTVEDIDKGVRTGLKSVKKRLKKL